MNKYKSQLLNVNRLTNNIQNAEDALQEAYLYQLEHGLDDGHMVNKAKQIAMNAYKRSKKIVYFDDVEMNYSTSDEFDSDRFDSFIEAKVNIDTSNFETKLTARSEYNLIFNQSSDTIKKLLVWMLRTEFDLNESARLSGYSVSYFKHVIMVLRQTYGRNYYT